MVWCDKIQCILQAASQWSPFATASIHIHGTRKNEKATDSQKSNQYNNHDTGSGAQTRIQDEWTAAGTDRERASNCTVPKDGNLGAKRIIMTQEQCVTLTLHLTLARKHCLRTGYCGAVRQISPLRESSGQHKNTRILMEAFKRRDPWHLLPF